MRYYTIIVADDGYKGTEPLTYSSEESLEPGQLVLVPLRRILVTGTIVQAVPKPSFNTKPIHVVFDAPPLPTASLQLIAWLQAFYAAPLGISAQQCIISSLTERTIARRPQETPLPDPDFSSLPPLTPEQAKLLSQLPQSGTSIIHGDTGTGKTRLYIEQALKSIAANRSVIVLTPEISLTSQLTESFQNVFGERAIVTHSGLSVAQRRAIWLQCLVSRKPLIVIGPRSALFSPLHDIGLIVIDEAHDDAYKQDSTPAYHATRVASKLATIYQAILLLGSATPSVADYFLATQKQRPILRITQRPKEDKTQKTETIAIDMRERNNFTQNPHLSDSLIRTIRAAREQGEQSLLFLNRRGTSRITLCSTCGWRALCDHCGTPMTFHEDTFSLKCHTCAKNRQVPAECPECGGGDILFRSVGTKAIESTVRSLFPGSTIMRFDTDNKKSERFEQHYESVKSGQVDILIGTQLLTKGLDLPRLSVVGVLNADLSLQIPDFTAEEKTYQLLSQVMGRVGRGHRSGTVIVQTYNPTNKAITDALSQNWDDFYKRELMERKNFMFPPFCYVLTLAVRRASNANAEKAALKLEHELQQKLGVQIEPPTPSYHVRVDGQYEWRIVIKAASRERLLTIARSLPSGWRFNIDPINLL